MDQLEKIEAYVRGIAAELDEMHGYMHFKTVADNAVLIAKSENYDEGAAYMAGILHDIGRSVYKGKWVKETNRRNHGVISSIMAEKILTAIMYPKTAEVCEAIRFHVRPRTQKTKLARILWDADKLCFYNSPNGEKFVKFLVKKGMNDKKALERLKHDWNFYYWLLYAEASKKIALEFMTSIGERVVCLDESDWEAPVILEKNATPFSEIDLSRLTV